MKRDVKVGLLVAAVVCGVAAILLGGGLVGTEQPSAPVLQVAGASALDALDAVSEDLSETITPPAELEAPSNADDDIVALVGTVTGAPAQPAAIAAAGAQDAGTTRSGPGSLPQLRVSDEVVLPGADVPAHLPGFATEAVAEHPRDFSAAAPSAGGERPAEPVDVAPSADEPVATAGRPAAVAVAQARATPDTGIAPPAGGVAAPPVATQVYVVQAGDSFFTISKKLFGTVRYFPDLQKANPNLDPRRMREGMRVAVPSIPGASPRQELLVAADASAASTTSTGSAVAAGSAGQAAPVTTRVYLAQDKVHVVQPGEILESISLKYYGKRQKWQHIVRANPGLDPRTLRPGMRIVIPALSE